MRVNECCTPEILIVVVVVFSLTRILAVEQTCPWRNRHLRHLECAASLITEDVRV